MINVALVRGAFLNNFEGQNYLFDKEISLRAFSSYSPLHGSFEFPVTRLPSLADIPVGKQVMRYICNRTIGDPQILFGLEKHMQGFDLVQTADPHYYYSYQLAMLRKKNKIKKLLLTSWETIPYNNEKTRAKRSIKRITMAIADHFLCYTEKAKQTLMIEGVMAEKVSVIPLGVSLNIFKEKKHKETKRTVYLFVGRLVPEKGVVDAYEAFKKIENGKHILRIIGDGPLKSDLKRKIDNDNLGERVSVEESTYAQMPKIYQESDVLVLPSKHTKTWEEQYGMVLIEAMASGLPITGYATGAIPEVTDGAALLVAENDIKALSSRMIELSIVQARREIGTMGRRRAELRYDSRKTAESLISLYKRIIST